MSEIDIKAIREQFPVLQQKINGFPLVYFDNAASTQKPLSVINRISGYYLTTHANVHRGNHYLSQKATEEFEEARKTVQSFINAQKPEEIIFTRGTTESINLIASVFGKKYFLPKDEIIITEMEHHSNIVPWQIMAEERKAGIKVAAINSSGELDVSHMKSLVNERTKLIAITHISNTLGSINPVKEIISFAHQHQIPVLVDGAQAIPHLKVNVQELDCDFYCFSGHKVYGPTGIGVLYGKAKWLAELPPYQGGGEMIETVTFEKTTYNKPPFKFEAGTPDIAGAIGLAEALRFVEAIGSENIGRHEEELLKYATEKINEMGGIRIIGTAREKAGVISFVHKHIHPGDIGVLLDKMGVAVRVGNHCTEPLMRKYGLPGTVRASFAVYNTVEEVDVFISSLKKAFKMLS
ncbi:MAG TPA: cysteine desulfurase [Bacteroidia bacterium]|nr:cysteine desulfurase [Bacteroidia bacterium]HRS59811.1 cysteine desulfurase [Bacteroidia bacterium]HRU69319.1 cysteine desulfurase [Bacteroidia bacterium]